MVEAISIFFLVAIAVGRLPWLKLNRAALALVGAVVLILVGGISLDQALASIDINTILLLFAMMVFISNLKRSGFFELIGDFLARRVKNAGQLLFLFSLASGILSAFFINDTLVLMLTPLVCVITLSAGLNPIPFLISLAVSANIGSAATIIGNPQNILIGSASGMDFFDFFYRMGPPSLLLLLLSSVIIMAFFPKDFGKKKIGNLLLKRPFVYKPLLWKSLAAFGIMVVGVILSWGLPLSALAGASFLLITRRVEPKKIFSDVEWTLLVFFSGLFVISRALEMTPTMQKIFEMVKPLFLANAWTLSGVSVALSNLIYNVPAVMVLRPLVVSYEDPQLGWLLLSAASTLAGNLTLLGSVANLIVAETAQKHGVRLSFWAYARVGIPLTLVTTALFVAWLVFIPG